MTHTSVFQTTCEDDVFSVQHTKRKIQTWREALQKKVANTDSSLSAARMHVGSNLYVFLFAPLLPTPRRMSKIDALYLYSSYMYSHIWRLFNSIKGTLVTLYTNIVEASLFHVINLSFFSVTVLNVQFWLVVPSLGFMWTIWSTFKLKQSLNSACTGLKNIRFLQDSRLSSLKEEHWGVGVGLNEWATLKVCTQGET